ncbi:hypothetical protein DPMN_075134 [Dreissena polymorpha]|uniref:Uncharacterized protein n=1 Tax=Dreissena polymorpha TaxID=45954 RepID=A0A9D3YJV3_DREPO|nr:hypothetical protein DPMN_075134 [Dreissena polymorpha]
MYGYIPLCSFYGGQYRQYKIRLLMLSSDVETNPGPGKGYHYDEETVTDDNTRRILQAIADTKEEVKSVKRSVQGVQQELENIKEELKIIKSKVDCLEYSHEVIASDVASVSLQDEVKEERLNEIERQLNSIENEKLKPFLRVFGLGE